MLAIGIVLALVLRSLVAPIYLILSVVLSYLASLGLAVLLFMKLGGQSGIVFLLPFLMFIFLLALGEDYNILVMTRIREEAGRRPLRQAVVRAVGATGPTVTSAGLVLAGSFAVLAIVGGSGSGGEPGPRDRVRPGRGHPARHLRRAHRAGALDGGPARSLELVAVGHGAPDGRRCRAGGGDRPPTAVADPGPPTGPSPTPGRRPWPRVRRDAGDQGVRAPVTDTVAATAAAPTGPLRADPPPGAGRHRGAHAWGCSWPRSTRPSWPPRCPRSSATCTAPPT